jgi:hypothetical protein
MKQHLTLVAALHIGLGVVGVLVAVIVVLGTILPGFIVLSVEGDSLPLGILSAIGCGVGLLVIVLSAPGIIGGIGLLKHRSWARYLILILSVLQLFNIPVGTAVGIYSFWALLQPEMEALFAGGSAE